MNLFSTYRQQAKGNALQAMGLQGRPGMAVKLRGEKQSSNGMELHPAEQGQKGPK